MTNDTPAENKPNETPKEKAPEPPKKKWYQKLGDGLGNALGEWFANR